MACKDDSHYHKGTTCVCFDRFSMKKKTSARRMTLTCYSVYLSVIFDKKCHKKIDYIA